MKKYNDIDIDDVAGKIITSNDLLDSSILEKFPEFNIENYFKIKGAYIFFYNSTNDEVVAVYNMLEEEKESQISVSINDITPDISLNQKYDLINNPLNVRYIQIGTGNNNQKFFKPDRQYTNGNTTYYQFNCDKINGYTKNNDGYFSGGDGQPTSIKFKYKPILLVNGSNKAPANIPDDGFITINATSPEYSDCTYLEVR